MRTEKLANTLPPLDVLLVDDEPHIRRTVSLHLEGSGHRVRSADGIEAAMREMRQRRFDVALVDLRLGGDTGLDLIPMLVAEDASLAIVVITAFASIETAVEAMRRGAKDYLPKPFTPAELDLVLSRMNAVARLQRRVLALEAERRAPEPNRELVFESAAMAAAVHLGRQAAPGDARILLRGESGTGKGVLARAVHGWSARRDHAFTIVSCPALPSELLESELFGHVRGAFTGATRDSGGRIALAEGGTLMLDEIGDLPLNLQPKLLRFIQDREYERVGDPVTRHADVRILAATNQDLDAAVAAGRFREDLLYRLDVLTIEVPPLRERPEDLMLLAERFLEDFARTYRKVGLSFSPSAVEALRHHAWPGNVRELKNAVERATMLAMEPVVEPELLLLKTSTSRPPEGPGPGDLASLADVEREHVERVVSRTASLKDAAQVLGIDQATLWRKRKQYES